MYRYAWVVLYYKRGHNVFCRYKDMHEHATVTYIVCAESRQGKATTNYVGSVFVTMISTRYDVFHGTRRPSGLVSRSQSGRQSQMVDVGSTGRLVLDKQRVVGKWVGRAGQKVGDGRCRNPNATTGTGTVDACESSGGILGKLGTRAERAAQRQCYHMQDAQHAAHRIPQWSPT